MPKPRRFFGPFRRELLERIGSLSGFARSHELPHVASLFSAGGHRMYGVLEESNLCTVSNCPLSLNIAN